MNSSEYLISIIIPCYNERNYISKCIDSIINQTFDYKTIEIIVVDGLSNDGSIEILNSYNQKYSNIKVISNILKTTPYALNLGIENSNSDIFMILGAHSYLDKYYIENCIKDLNEKDIYCVGGYIENIYENNVSKIIGLAMSSKFGVGNADFRTIANKTKCVDTVAFGTYKKVIVEQIGYFDILLKRNQDDEFNFRLTKNNMKILLSKNLKSYYYVRSSFRKLFKQYFQYGFWKVYVNKKHRTITTIRQMIPFILVCFILFFPFLFLFTHFFTYIYLSIIVLYLTLALKFSMEKTNNFKEIFLVIYTFILLHISYGFGYLIGIIYFILLLRKPNYKKPNISR